MAIRVLIADDIANTREDIKRLLYFEDDIDVIGEASDGIEAVRLASELKPDIILMDINMPKLDGIGATEQISLNVPESAIIIISIQGEQDYLRRAMTAGAREYLIKPFSANELAGTIRRIYKSQKRRNEHIVNLQFETQGSTTKPTGRIITFFCTKGGVGKTVLASNLAVTLATKAKNEVALVDLDLAAGDVCVTLNIAAKATIADLAQEQETIDISMLNTFLVPHISGVRILPAPLSPEQAELITHQHIEHILEIMRENFDFIIVDTAPSYNDINLAVLEASDYILLIANQDLTTLKHVKTACDILTKLNYEHKIRIIANSVNNNGIKLKDLEDTLNKSMAVQITEDQKVVKNSINKGLPFVMSHPNGKVTSDVNALADIVSISGSGKAKAAAPQKNRKSVIGRLFSI